MNWINAGIVVSLAGAGLLLARLLLRPEKSFPPVLTVDTWGYCPTNEDRHGRWVELGGPTLNRQSKEKTPALVCLGCELLSPDCTCMDRLDRSKRFKPNPAAFSENENGTGYASSLHVRDATVTTLAPADRERLNQKRKHQ